MEFALTQEDAREFSLTITGIDVEGGPDHLTLWLDHEEAVQLFLAVEDGIGGWVADYRFYKAEHAKHQDDVDPGEGYELDDPKSPGFYERAVEAYDNREKGS
jgi:hypothetical protein